MVSHTDSHDFISRPHTYSAFSFSGCINIYLHLCVCMLRVNFGTQQNWNLHRRSVDFFSPTCVQISMLSLSVGHLHSIPPNLSASHSSMFTLFLGPFIFMRFIILLIKVAPPSYRSTTPSLSTPLKMLNHPLGLYINTMHGSWLIIVIMMPLPRATATLYLNFRPIT